MITLNANTLRGLAHIPQNPATPTAAHAGLTLKPVTIPAAPASMSTSTLTLAQLPLLAAAAGGLRMPATASPTTPLTGLTAVNPAQSPATLRPATAIPLNQLLSQLAAGNQGTTLLSLAPQQGTTMAASNVTPTVLSLTPQGAVTAAVAAPTHAPAAAMSASNTSAQALASIGKLVSSVSSTAPAVGFTLPPASTPQAASVTAATSAAAQAAVNLALRQVMTTPIPAAQLITPAQLQQFLNQQAAGLTLAAPATTMSAAAATPASAISATSTPVLAAATSPMITPASATSVPQLLTSTQQPARLASMPGTQLMSPMTVLSPGVQLANSGVAGLTQAQLQAQVLKSLAGAGQIPILQQQLAFPMLAGNKPLVMVTMPNMVTPATPGATVTLASPGTHAANQPMTLTLANPPPVSKS